MSEKKEKFSRRDFIKTAGTVGLGSVLLPFGSMAEAQTDSPALVPARPFGKTGVNVSILGLGADLGLQDLICSKTVPCTTPRCCNSCPLKAQS